MTRSWSVRKLATRSDQQSIARRALFDRKNVVIVRSGW